MKKKFNVELERLGFVRGEEIILTGVYDDAGAMRTLELSADEAALHDGHNLTVVMGEDGLPVRADCTCGTQDVGQILGPRGDDGPTEPPATARTCPVCELVGFDCGHRD